MAFKNGKKQTTLIFMASESMSHEIEQLSWLEMLVPTWVTDQKCKIGASLYAQEQRFLPIEFIYM